MLLPHWGYGIFGFSPSFTHFHPFSHFFAPSQPLFSLPWGTREGRGDVAILISPHQHVQPMRQAKLLRIHIVDRDIEHQLLCRAISSSSRSSSSSKNSHSGCFSGSSDSLVGVLLVVVQRGSSCTACALRAYCAHRGWDTHPRIPLTCLVARRSSKAHMRTTKLPSTW